MSEVDVRMHRTQWDLFWVPPDVRVVDRPEILYLACDRDEPYLNVVLRVDAPEEALPALVEEVDHAHTGVGSRFQLPAVPSPLARLLTARSYAPTATMHVRCVEVTAWAPREVPGVVVRPVRTLDDLRAAVEVADRAFALRPFARDLPALLEACTAEGARVHRFVAWDAVTGDPLSAGGLNAYPDLGIGLLWAGATVPEGRGRGAYTALVDARIRRARALGLARVGLFARDDTSGPIVGRLGFRRHGPLVHWERPP